LTTYDQAYEGRNRRYYKITELGEQQLELIKRDWAELKKVTDNILEENHG
jgi:hypothetical protein